MLGASGAEVSLNGTWLSDECNAFNTSRDYLQTLTISGSSWTNTREEYATDDECTGDIMADRVVSATLTVGDEAELDLGGEAVMGNEAETVPSSSLRTVYDADLVDAFNSAMVCGFDDWEVGVAKEIIDSEETGCTYEDSYRYGFFIDDEVTPNQLYVAGAVPSTEDYPTTLNDSYPLSKQ